MHRILSINFLAGLLVPVALLLILFGIKRLNVSGNSGLFLKPLLALNTVLLVLTGSASADEEVPIKTCYVPMVADDDVSAISYDSDPTNSPYWSDLEDAVIKIESSLVNFGYSGGRENGTLNAAENAISAMENENTISSKTADVLRAYVKERWIRANEEIDCYDRAVPPPDPAFKERDEILEQVYTLADLRAAGKLGDSAYAAAETSLTRELADYIPKDERPFALELIMDLVDEVHDRTK